MTNEDAIKWLSNLKNDIGNPHYEGLWPYAQAIDEITELLEEQEAREQCLKTKCIICPHCDNCDVDENGLRKEADVEKDRGQMKRPKETFWDSLSEADLMEPMHHFQD